jgi:hypothetical protein
MLIPSDCIAFFRATSAAAYRVGPALLLLPALLLAACGQQGALPYGQIGPLPTGELPQRYYPPPGPPGDPWGPYIREAAGRYRVPDQWVRAVMQQESGGEEQAVSPVGAMGLMQVMPETYADLQARYGLGADPYDPHNNILAGTAYIREMYDRFGSPGFLAGYNAGPDRVDAYLAGQTRLPNETVNYIAAITPNLGDAVPPSGPLARYAAARLAGGTRARRTTVASLAAGCDLNAAYDPNHPCTSLELAAVAPAPVPEDAARSTGTNGCDLDAAYDPNHPCRSLPQLAAASTAPVLPQTATNGCALDAAYEPDHPCTAPPPQAAVALAVPQNSRLRRLAANDCAGYPCPPARGSARPVQLAFNADCSSGAALARPCAETAKHTVARASAAEQAAAVAGRRPPPRRVAPIAGRDWAIQVGAFANPTLARAVAEGARRQAPSQLRYASLTLPATPFRRSILYRARLAHLSEREAAEACTHLNRRQLPCVVVRPSRS